MIVAFSGSLVTFVVTYFAHRYYASEVKRVFFKEMQEEQDRLFRQAFVGGLVLVKDDPVVSLEPDARASSRNTELDNRSDDSPRPAGNWADRDRYRSKTGAHDGAESILQLHSKRLHVLEERRALEMFYATRPDPRRTGAFCGHTLGKPAADFFGDGRSATYALGLERRLAGDRQLLVSEMRRSGRSRVNLTHCVVTPFLVLCAGLCAAAMFAFDDAFAQAVFVMIAAGYLLDCFVFRLLYILAFCVFKTCLARRRGYFSSKGVYCESEVEVALKVQELLKAKKLKRTRIAEEQRLKREQEEEKKRLQSIMDQDQQDLEIKFDDENQLQNELGDIAEEDEPDESLHEDASHPQFNNVSQSNRSPKIKRKKKQKSPKNKSPKARSPKSKSPRQNK